MGQEQHLACLLYDAWANDPKQVGIAQLALGRTFRSWNVMRNFICAFFPPPGVAGPMQIGTIELVKGLREYIRGFYNSTTHTFYSIVSVHNPLYNLSGSFHLSWTVPVMPRLHPVGQAASLTAVLDVDPICQSRISKSGDDSTFEHSSQNVTQLLVPILSDTTPAPGLYGSDCGDPRNFVDAWRWIMKQVGINPDQAMTSVRYLVARWPKHKPNCKVCKGLTLHTRQGVGRALEAQGDHWLDDNHTWVTNPDTILRPRHPDPHGTSAAPTRSMIDAEEMVGDLYHHIKHFPDTMVPAVGAWVFKADAFGAIPSRAHEYYHTRWSRTRPDSYDGPSTIDLARHKPALLLFDLPRDRYS